MLLSLACQLVRSELGQLAQELLLIQESEHLVFLVALVALVVLTLW